MRALAGLMVRGIPSSTLRRFRSQSPGFTLGGIVPGEGGHASWGGCAGRWGLWV
jgi:hypothetical protein